MLSIDQNLSANFTFGEMVRSETAERVDGFVHQQCNPSEQVLESLLWLCQHTLQPIRDIMRSPLAVSSGYRCSDVNALVGGSKNSAHCKGEAADITLPLGGELQEVIQYVDTRVMERIGKPVRPDVNRNFYLFALICLNLEKLDIDQVVHEYGPAYGQPAWVHVSSSERQNKREILVVGRYIKNGSRTRILCVDEALKLGV